MASNSVLTHLSVLRSPVCTCARARVESSHHGRKRVRYGFEGELEELYTYWGKGTNRLSLLRLVVTTML